MMTLKDYNKLKNVNLSEIEKSHERTHIGFSLLEMYQMRNLTIPYIVVIFITAVTLIFAKLNLYEIYESIAFLVLILIYAASVLVGLVINITYDARIEEVAEILKFEEEERDRLWDAYYYWEVTDQYLR